MNARGILEQLMKQAGGSTKPHRSDSSFDVNKLASSGALGMLLGSRRGRRMGTRSLKYGVLVGVGKLAFDAWQRSRQAQASSHTDAPSESLDGGAFEQLDDEAKERRSRGILAAMIASARADGHIDDAERRQLTEQIDSMGADDELRAWIDERMQAPLDAEAVAREAESPQAAREMYLASVAIVDDENDMERAWLDQLATALRLDPQVVKELEREVSSIA